MAAESTRRLGENIRARREELGLTQEQVAREMAGHVSGDRVSKWERGENRPRDETLDDLARVLETTVAQLLGGHDRRVGATPTPFPPKTIEGELAVILEGIKKQLAEQTDVLRRIEERVTAAETATAATEDARRRLLEAAEVASRAYEDAARRLAEARDKQAT